MSRVCIHHRDTGKRSNSGEQLFYCTKYRIHMNRGAPRCIKCSEYEAATIIESELDEVQRSQSAQRIINGLRNGVVPPSSSIELTVGREIEKEVIASDLEAVSMGEYRIRFIMGDPGTGKTHLLDYISEYALREDFVISRVIINSDRPLKDLNLVYRSMMDNLLFPDMRENSELGWALIQNNICINDLRTKVPERIEKGVERIKTCRYDRKLITHLLAGHKVNIAELRRQVKGFGIVRLKIVEDDILPMISGFIRVFSNMGYTGTVILIDEVEKALNDDRKQKAFDNLIAIINTLRNTPCCYLVVGATTAFMHDFQQFIIKESYPREKGFNEGAGLRETEIIRLEGLTRKEILELINRIMSIHAEAFDWEPTTVVCVDDILAKCDEMIKKNAFPTKQTVRGIIRMITTLLELAYQYPDLDISKEVIIRG